MNGSPTRWPTTPEQLAREQQRVAALPRDPWVPPGGALRVGACAVVFSGRQELGWAAAVVEEKGAVIAAATIARPVVGPFRPGQLALREGPILEAVVRGLRLPPDVLLVAAAGRDHPHRAGLALHLGAVLGLPTVGVTDDPLLASGEPPATAWGSRAPLRIGGELVAWYVRTRGGTKPVVAHAAWRTSPEVAAEIVLGACALARWPEPMREARRLARETRQAATRGSGC